MDASKVLEDIVQSTIGAKTHFDMWWALANQARLAHEDVLEEHCDFFDATYDAHYTSFFVYIAHLFDKRADSSSIPRYFQLMGSKAGSPWNQNLENRFAKIAIRAEPLVIARHKTVAHVDALLSEKDVFAPFDTTWNDVRAILTDIVAFVIDIRGAKHPGEIGIPRDGRMKEALFSLLEQLDSDGTRET